MSSPRLWTALVTLLCVAGALASAGRARSKALVGWRDGDALRGNALQTMMGGALSEPMVVGTDFSKV